MMRHNDHDRIAIIGAGHVGTSAYALMLRALVREIVLIDSDIGLAGAEVTDISDASVTPHLVSFLQHSRKCL